MGAGASSNKRRGSGVAALDAERAEAEEYRLESAGGRMCDAAQTNGADESKSSNSQSPKQRKRRPMPIPSHVFEDDALSKQRPRLSRSPPSPQAAAGHESFQSLLSIDDEEIVMVARHGQSPRNSTRNLEVKRDQSASGTSRKARRGRKLAPRGRFNSTSSWYSVRTTMGSAPKEATVRCIATVLLRHMAAHKSSEGIDKPLSQKKYEVFNDSPEVYVEEKGGSGEELLVARGREAEGRSVFHRSPPPARDIDQETGRDGGEGKQSTTDNNSGRSGNKFQVPHGMPSVNKISEFVNYVFTKAQLEIDGLIIAFIYLERLLAKAFRDGVHLLCKKNWRTLCFVSLMLASKIWDDFSMDNADFAIVWKPMTLQRVNQLERKVLEVLRYNVSIPASDYAACYFKLRSLVTSLGLPEDELKMVRGQLRPMSSAEAYKFEALSERYQRSVGSSIERQQSSVISTPLVNSDRHKLDKQSVSQIDEVTSSNNVQQLVVRRAKSGRRLMNNNKSRSFCAMGMGDDGNLVGQRRTNASVEGMMRHGAGSKSSAVESFSSGSRQPWKQSR